MLKVQTDLPNSELESASNYPHPALRRGVFHVLGARVLEAQPVEADQAVRGDAPEATESDDA